YIAQQGGQIRLYEPGVGLLPEPFLDLSRVVLADSGERGLLGLAFHPRYSANPADPDTTGALYVHYTSRAGTVAGSPAISLDAGDVVIARYVVSTRSAGFAGTPSPTRADPASRVILKTAPHASAANHNGGQLAFDRATGDLFIADVGQDNWEGIDLQRHEELGPPGGPIGRNYCWSRLEGSHPFNGDVACALGVPTLPILQYDHSQGDCAITGGYRYRGTAIPTLHGAYVHGDYCSGRIWAAIESGSGAWLRPLLLDTSLRLSAFGEDEA